MQKFILIFSSLFAWAVFDPHLFRKRGRVSTSSPQIELSVTDTELDSDQLAETKQQRQTHDVIPKHLKSTKTPIRSRCNYFKTKPRDVRFSNQRKIRRMFSNL